MELPTRYDIEMRRLGVINRDSILSDLEALSNISENAKKLLEELNTMKCEIITIEENLEKEEMLDRLDKYYNCLNCIHIMGVYNIIIVKFNYKRDESITVTNFESAKDIIYEAYKEDREKFINCIHQWCNEPNVWMYYFKEQKPKENKVNITIQKYEINNIDIPEVPYVPF